MHQGAHGNLFAYARNLRAHMTVAEKILWEELRGKQVGVKFRRQHPLQNYIADFYCHEIKLVIEVDGNSHDDPVRQIEDKDKDLNLMLSSHHLLRFTNEQIINYIDYVMHSIKTFIDCLQANRNSVI